MPRHELPPLSAVCLLALFSWALMQASALARCLADDSVLREQAQATVESLVQQWNRAVEAEDFDAAESVVESIVAMRQGAVSPLVGMLSAHGHRRIRFLAIGCLHHIGLEAIDAVPALIKATTDQDPMVRCGAIRALERIKPGWSGEHVPLLIRLLHDEDALVSSDAASELGHTGSAGKAAIPHLIAVMEDERRDLHARGFCADSLALLDPGSPEVVEALIRAVADDTTAGSAIRALGSCGANAKMVVPILVQVVERRARGRSSRAAEALGKLGPQASSAVGVLAAALGGEDWSLAQTSARALGRIGPAAADAVPALLRAVSAEDRSLRISAVEALGHIGAPARIAIPTLLEGLRRAHPHVRRASAGALGQIGAETDSQIVSALEAALEDKDSHVRVGAAGALAQLGAISDRAVACLAESLETRETNFDHTRAIKTLGNIGPEASSAVDVLTTALRDNHSHRAYIAEALGKIGLMTSDVRASLVTAMGDEKAFVRAYAAEALSRNGCSVPESIETLVAIVDTWDFDSSMYHAIRALGRIAPVRPDVLPALAAALRADQPMVRIAVAEELGRIGHAARTEIPALTEALNDKNAPVRDAAAEALKKIAASAPSAPDDL